MIDRIDPTLHWPLLRIALMAALVFGTVAIAGLVRFARRGLAALAAEAPGSRAGLIRRHT